MNQPVEIVVPTGGLSAAAVKRLRAEAEVVPVPSSKNVDRLVVASTELEVSAVDVIKAIRARLPKVPVVYLETGASTKSGVRSFIQRLVLASSARQEATPFVAPDAATLMRIVRAHLAGAQAALIAAVQAQDGQLWVWSCEPRLYRCDISSLPALQGLSRAALASVEVSKSGSRLRWPTADIDLTLDSIQAAADASVRAKQERRYREDARRYAKAIRTLRESRGLSQSSIPGVSDRQVRRIESGARIPHAATLEKLAAAHSMGVTDYMQALAKSLEPRKGKSSPTVSGRRVRGR